MTSCLQLKPPDPDADAGRYLLLIEGVDPGDALLRVLGLIAVQQARVTALTFDRRGHGFRAKLEVENLGVQRAEHLSRRLAQLPVVESVSFGWSGGPPTGR